MKRKTSLLRLFAAQLAGSLLAAACAAEAGDATVPNPSASERAPQGEAQAIEASKVGDVWIFLNNSLLSLEARLEGQAQIVDGCLHVDEYVVVWKKPDLLEVQDFVGSLLTRAPQTVVLGGGG